MLCFPHRCNVKCVSYVVLAVSNVLLPRKYSFAVEAPHSDFINVDKVGGYCTTLKGHGYD